jgi:hypothetical protein
MQFDAADFSSYETKLPSRNLPRNKHTVDWVLGGAVLASDAPATLPWKVNKRIGSVKRDLFAKHPRPLAASLAAQHYVGPKLERLEYQGLEVAFDVAANHRWRFSRNNGRNWELFEPVIGLAPEAKGVSGGPTVFDPKAEVLVCIGMRQFDAGGLWNNYICYKYSRTAIDDRQPGPGARFQLSNFSLWKSHALEMILTTYSQEPDPSDWLIADAYKYTLTLNEPDNTAQGNTPSIVK